MAVDEQRARHMAARFAGGLEVAALAPHGQGRIHDTFVVELRGAGEGQRLLLQRINEHVFRDLHAVMANVERVCTHLQGKLAVTGVAGPERRALQLTRTPDGLSYVRADDGSAYRAFRFVDRAHSLPGASTLEQAREAGRAFGELQRWLSDLPAPPLWVTIPGFHDTTARLATLEAAAVQDVASRAAEVGPELSALRARATVARQFASAVDSGGIPPRIAHNDAKLDNVLFDDATGRALCVVDLDTVMPGSWLHDFGDLSRSMACGQVEDAVDPSALCADVGLLAALTEGYVGEVGPHLTDAEWEYLVLAPQVIALELAARFLTDHLQGDHYFQVERVGQNLARARVQLRVLTELERVAPQLGRVIERLRQSLRG